MAGYALTALFAYLFVDLTIVALPVASVAVVGLLGVCMYAWFYWQVKTNRYSAPVHHIQIRVLFTLVFIIFIAAHIVTASVSISPERAIEQLTTLGIAASAYFISMSVAHVLPRGAFLGALRNASWVYVAATALDALRNFGPGYRPPAPNVVAAIFSLLLLPTLAEMFDDRPRWPRVVWTMAAFAVVYVSASRGAWLGLAAGLAALAARRWAALNFVRAHWPVVVAVLITALSAGALWQLNQHTSPSVRWEMWVLATAAFLYSPWVGTGPGTFAALWHAMYPLQVAYPHAHSIIFNTAAEQGLIGLAALAALALAALRASWRDAGLFAALVAFGAHSLVDSVNVIPEVALTLAVLLGSRLATPEETP